MHLSIRPTVAEASGSTAAEAAPTESDAAKSARQSAEGSTDPVDRLAAWLLSKRRT